MGFNGQLSVNSIATKWSFICISIEIEDGWKLPTFYYPGIWVDESYHYNQHTAYGWGSRPL